MSFRAVLIGFLLSLTIAAVGYLNDSVLRLTMMVGNHFPISVFGLLLLIAMLANPLLYMLRPAWRLRPGELAVIIALALVACSIPGSGLMRHFHTALVLPAHYNRTEPGWQRNRVLRYTPETMLPAGGEMDPEVTEPFISGGASARGRGFGLAGVFDRGNVPWGKWAPALLTWYPPIILMTACVICLSLMVHPQWAHRERLRYPVASVGQIIMQQDKDRATGSIFRNRLFWVGLVVVMAIHCVNGVAKLYPRAISIPLSFPMPQILQQFPKLNVMYANNLFNPTLYPTVVAFAFFLASDVSLSLGLSQAVHVLLIAALTAMTVDLSGGSMIGGPVSYQKFGSYLGIGLLLLYTGRRYYWDVLRQALAFARRQGVEAYAVWACRILVLVGLALATLLSWLGLSWPFAALAVPLMLLMFLVMARINAESGLFFIASGWHPLAVLVGLFGLTALGPTNIVILGLLCVVLMFDTRESLMPFMVNALKMTDDAKVRPGRTGLLSGGVYLAGLAVATVVVFWACYNLGGPARDGWAWKHMPKFTHETATTTITMHLKPAGQLEASEQFTPVQRLAHASPRPGFVPWAAVGLALVLVFAVLRLRFTWWPIHPVMFLVWGSYQLACFSHSFLLGWMIKAAVTRFGGGRVHRQAVPLMIGVVAGDLLGGLTFMIQGAAYYWIHDVFLPWSNLYHVFPV